MLGTPTTPTTETVNTQITVKSSNANITANTVELSCEIKDWYIPLTFTAETDNSTIDIWLSKASSAAIDGLQYRTNIKDEWSTYTFSGTFGERITLTNIGDYVQFQNTNTQLSISNNDYVHFYISRGTIAASGNIQSMLNYLTSCSEQCYYKLFYYCTSLTKAPELPATTLANYCYERMFEGCTSLTKAPELPATTLADHCYDHMFLNCTSLTTAPSILPATTLTESCYYYMFQSCENLTSAPELPASSLASRCYGYMFIGCTSLTKAPDLPASSLASRCYEGMFNDCTSLSSVPDLPAALTDYCYAGMFSGCTNLTEAPELPATTLAYACYSNMFKGCSNLEFDFESFIKKHKNSKLAKYCFARMVIGCTKVNENRGLIAVEDLAPASSLEYGCYAGLYNGCTSITEIPENYLTGICNSPTDCSMLGFESWFENCTNLSAVPSNLLPFTTLADDCYENMFDGCTSLSSAPDLPATNLADHCYAYMFSGCTSLSSINVGFTDWNEDGYSTSGWVDGVADVGTFVCPAALVYNDDGTSDPSYGNDYIPERWTVETY